jgi:hypothetical protein
MNGLSDSLTIGILLVLIFGAVSFYLYSRLSQNEKRVSLLENLLLTLKMNTEASLEGHDMVESMGGPVHLSADDIESVHEEDYAEMLKDIPNKTNPSFTETNTKNAETKTKVDEVASAARNTSRDEVASAARNTSRDEVASAEEDAEDLLRSMEDINNTHSMDVNYESMSVKELRVLAKERNITGIPQNKSAIIDLLKKKGGALPSAITPLTEQEGELDGAKHETGYTIEEL